MSNRDDPNMLVSTYKTRIIARTILVTAIDHFVHLIERWSIQDLAVDANGCNYGDIYQSYKIELRFTGFDAPRTDIFFSIGDCRNENFRRTVVYIIKSLLIAFLLLNWT